MDLVTESILSRDARLGRAGLASALILVLGSILMLGPEGLPMCSCLFREITGMSCLTCGLTRSVQAASQGHLQAALQFHLLGPFVVAAMLMGAVACATEASTGRPLLRFRSTRRVRHALLTITAIWIVHGIVRAVVELI